MGKRLSVIVIYREVVVSHLRYLLHELWQTVEHHYSLPSRLFILTLDTTFKLPV
jgi:hypothetical protein